MFESKNAENLFSIDNSLLHLRKKSDKLNINAEFKPEKLPF